MLYSIFDCTVYCLKYVYSLYGLYMYSDVRYRISI